jgi:uncharacterized protein DUF1259
MLPENTRAAFPLLNHTTRGITSTAGVKMTPPMGLTSWAAFEHEGKDDMVMGDIVMTEDQVSPVMSAALDNGLEVTALHNHFIWDSPRIMFMHIGGMGQEQNLATAVGKVFAVIQQTAGKSQRINAKIDPAHSSLDPTKLDSALGVKGQYKGGVYKFAVGRKTRMHDIEIGNQMGVNTWGAFAGSDDNAIVDGDFAMRESELQDVLKTLRKAGINVVAIHQHMIGEQPRHVPPLLGRCIGQRSSERTSSCARRYSRLIGGPRLRRSLKSHSAF